MLLCDSFITIFPDEVRSVAMPTERIKWSFVTSIPI